MIADFPGPVTLRPSIKWAAAAVLLVGLLVVGGYAAIVGPGSWPVGIGLFAIAGVVMYVGIQATRPPYGLKLGLECFEVIGFLRRERYYWRDVRNFRVVKGRVKVLTVVFDIVGENPREGRTLPLGYEIGGEALGDVMRAWQAHALSQSSADD